MKQNSNISEIHLKLKAYKRKYYVNKIVKGIIYTLGFSLLLLLVFSAVEFKFQLGSRARTILFALSAVSFLYFLIRFLLIPVYHLIQNGQHLSDADAASQIGKYFPEIQDKLLNIIQLNNLSSRENSLITASIKQKYEKISPLNFSESISIKKSNAGYLPYLIIPSIVMLLILMVSPNMITEGSYRILKFNEEFIPEAPFTFTIENENLKGFKGESFTIRAKLEGTAIPEELFINKEELKQRFTKISRTEYKYVLKNVQKSLDFRLEASGFTSATYTLEIFEKPSVQDMNITLDYPDYIGTATERINNSGNLIVPEGTKAQWLIKSSSSDKLSVKFNSDSTGFTNVAEHTFKLSKILTQGTTYNLYLFNTEASYNEQINYSIKVIKDSYPEINLLPINDSTYFSQIALAGDISDDYGFSNLRLYYKQTKQGQVLTKGSLPLSYDKNILSQKYFKLWRVDSLLTDRDIQLEYFIQVDDNDAINGAKSSRSATYTFQLPDDEEISEEISKTSQSTENQINKNIESAIKANKQIEELEEILKTKRNLDWEDKKLIEEIFQNREDRRQELERIKDKLEKNQSTRERFNKQDQQLQEKSEQLESLMEEMLQDENDKLMEKIKSLLKDQEESDEIRESVQDLQKQEKNRLKEMERLMELFKRMEIQYDIKQVGAELEELEKEQQALADENEADFQKPASEKDSVQNDSDKENQQDGFKSESDKNKALQEQENLNQEFENIQEKLREIEKRNQSLKQPNPLQDTKEQENEIDLNQQNSKQNIQDNNKSGASEQQKKSAQEMKKMSEMLSSMQMGMEMEMLQENIDDLRNIVDNLLKLSFRQEELFTSFKEVNPSDPRFISLSEQQLAMQDDAKIIEDSLVALSERVFQIKNFINKELDKMNESMEASVQALKVRENNKAIGEQQFAMTAMNNLALMLDDVLEQMQMQMQSSMGMGEPSKGNQQMPSLSEMQKSLNQKTQELSQGQKSGRQFSEQLGELAREQAQIRKMMENLEKQLGKDGEDGSEADGGTSKSVTEEMEKIEEDLVNKRLSRDLIQRQQQIVTRLLESEKAREEQEEDNERKAETATEYERQTLPNAFEDYIKEKQKEIERLRNVTPSFTPYYKNEINKYYNRLKTKENLIR